MSEFAGLWTYERAPGPTQIWLDPTGAGTPPSRLERFGYWSVKTRAFDGRDVDRTEQPVGRLPGRLGQATVVTAPPPATAPTSGESKCDRFGQQAQARPAPSGLGISAQYWPDSHLQNGPCR